MVEKVYKVLFLGRENVARSLMAEALLRELAGDRFEVYSAGLEQAGAPDPMALRTLQLAKMPTDGLRPKLLQEATDGGAREFDFVITVSDRVSHEELPSFAGKPMIVHWGTDDPTEENGSQSERQVVYGRALRQLRNRIEVFVNLSIDRLDRLVLKAKMDTLGEVRPRE